LTASGTKDQSMWFDKPKKWWVYRWTHHFWVLSFNRNPDLYRVVWWSKYTRFLFWNTRGRVTGGGDFAFLAFFIPFVLFITAIKLIWG